VPAVIEAEPSLMALEGVDFRFWQILLQKSVDDFREQ